MGSTDPQAQHWHWLDLVSRSNTFKKHRTNLILGLHRHRSFQGPFQDGSSSHTERADDCMFSSRNQASQSNSPYKMIQKMTVFNGENHRNKWIHGGYMHGLSSHVWLPKGPGRVTTVTTQHRPLPCCRHRGHKRRDLAHPLENLLQGSSNPRTQHRWTSVNIGEHRWSLEWLWKFIPPKYVVSVMIYVTNCYNRFWSILKSCTKSPWSYE